MISVELSGAADADLDTILDYGIDAYGREAAEAYLRLIHDVLNRLTEFPEIGSLRPELREGLRSAPVKEHRIYYRFVGERILVARVLHKARDVELHL